MKRTLITLSLITLSLTALATILAPAQPKLTKDNIPEVVKAMTTEEKAAFVVGVRFRDIPEIKASTLQGTAGITYAIPRLGIPSIVMMDGPVGIRLDNNATTSLPGGLLTAASWDKEVAFGIGGVIADESLAMGCDVILGPGMNLLRNPLNGRNFEYFSEDPVLSGMIAAAYINGVQDKGVGTSAKHFAANNQETNRLECDSRIDARTLRELYIKGFELCVRDAQPWTIMASYNYLNGEYTQESYSLLTNMLRRDCGYDGLVVTDWIGKRNTPKQLHAGSDLLMGGHPNQTEHILQSLQDGSLTMADLDRCVTKLLELIVKTPTFHGNARTLQPDLDKGAAKARALAAEGMVLLKNNGALPITKGDAALFGVYSYDMIPGGNGAGYVYCPYVRQLDEGLQAAGIKVDAALQKLYRSYASYISEDLLSNHRVNTHVGVAQKPELEVTRELVEAAASRSDYAIVTLGRTSGEARDRVYETDFLIQENERALLQNVCEVYHAAGKKVIVVLNICGAIETASWSKLPDAILCAWLPGEEAGNAIADVLTGRVNPSGKLPMTFPIDYFDIPGAEDFPYDFRSNIANESAVHPEQRGLPLKNLAYTDYTEGIYVGYRHFCTREKPVSYPFGYGLSYTTFEYSKPAVIIKNGNLIATITVTNTGSTAGKEAVGLYVHAPLGSLKDKPSIELKEFGKTKLLAPGESETLNFCVPLRQLASFDTPNSRWELASGSYQAFFGADCTRPQASVPFKIASRKLYFVYL